MIRSDDGLPLQTGALPWRRNRATQIEVILVTGRRTPNWIVPKGWPMPGKSLPEAAAQEAFEEAGVKGVISETELGWFHHEKSHLVLGSFTCSIILFPMRVSQVLRDWPEKGERSRRWYSLTKAADRVQSGELKELILQFAGSQ